MTLEREALEDLKRLVVALEPFLDDLVLVGGWAAWLYTRENASSSVLFTTDVDWAVPPSLDAAGPTLLDRMEASDFVPVVVGPLSRPPATRYQHARHPERAPVYAEFLTDYHGKDGGPRTAEISGIVAQRLRYMKLALLRPIAVDISKHIDVSLAPGRSVAIPHPANYVIHKLLVVGLRRSVREQAKDHAYLYEVLRATRPRWADMHQRVDELGREVPPRWIQRAKNELAKRFSSQGDVGPVDTAAVLGELLGSGGPSPAAVARVVALAAEAIGLTP